MKRRTWALFIVLAATGGAWLASSRDGGGATSGASRSTRPAEPSRPPTPRSRAPSDDAPSVVAAPDTPSDPGAGIPVLEGRVVDAETGKPITGAALKWGYVDPAMDEMPGGLRGSTADDGSLSFRRARSGPLVAERPDEAELWVSAKGYAVARVRAPKSPVDVRLSPVPDRPPGSLRVRMLRGDRVPCTGLVHVDACDEFGDIETLCGIADADGRFTLLGVPVRFTRVRIDDGAPWTSVAVRPGDWADVDLLDPAAVPRADREVREPVVKRRDAAAVEMAAAEAREDDVTYNAAAERWHAATHELNLLGSEQFSVVIANLPTDSAPLVELRMSTHGTPVIWRLRVAERRAEFCSANEIVSWNVAVTRAGGGVETRFMTLLPSNDGSAYETPPGGRFRSSYPLTKDDTLVVDWEKLVAPDAK